MPHQAAVPVGGAAADALRWGFVPGASRRNLDWVRPHLSVEGSGIGEDDLVLLADAQTSGGLLVVGEDSGATVAGESVHARQGGTAVVS